MGKGLIHIYCGDGKGKTSAATGLAVRAAGCGKQVLFARFLPDILQAVSFKCMPDLACGPVTFKPDGIC